jgi:hypothetical protein
MPKTPHDTIAVLILLGAVFLGAFVLKRAGRELTATQRATLKARGTDAVAIAGTFGFAVAYFYAPVQPLWALVGTVACIALVATRLVRHHSSQDYTPNRKTFLIVGLAIQGIGFLAAIIVRAVG